MGGGGKAEGTQNFFRKGCGLGGGRKARCYPGRLLQGGHGPGQLLENSSQASGSGTASVANLEQGRGARPKSRAWFEGIPHRALGEGELLGGRRWPLRVSYTTHLHPLLWGPSCVVSTGLTCSWEDSSCPATQLIRGRKLHKEP